MEPLNPSHEDRPESPSPDPAEQGRAEGEARKRRKTAAVERSHRALVRRVQRAFLRYLMENATGTTDAIRDVLAIPDGAGTAFWGASVLGLAAARIIRRVEFAVSSRPERHGCRIGEWTLAVDHDRVRHWLQTHQDLRDDEGPGGEPGAACTPPPEPPSPAPLASSPPT